MKDIALGMAGQAICAALIESYCNEIEVEIKKEFSESYLKSRFSPGYGDWDLSAQAEILDMLATAKQIGLSYTSGMMLSPLKSVTAVIGISEKNDCKQEDKCKICKMKNCQFRKE